MTTMLNHLNYRFKQKINILVCFQNRVATVRAIRSITEKFATKNAFSLPQLAFNQN